MKEKTTIEDTNVITDSETFVAKVFKIGDSLAIVVPARNCGYSGIKEGDYVKIWYKKKK